MSIHDDDGMRSRVEADAAAEEQAQAESEQAQAESEQGECTNPNCGCYPKVARVSHIGLSRLFNLGNYENIKFDVSVEVPEGQSAALAMSTLLKIMQKLRPVKLSWEVQRAQKLLNTPETELEEVDRETLEQAKALVEEHNAKVRERKEALRKLDTLGGSIVGKDAKDSWEFDDDYED